MGVALLAGAAALFLGLVFNPVLAAGPVIVFCLWRNAKAVCPRCGSEPFYPRGEVRTHSVGWNAESIALWGLLGISGLVAAFGVIFFAFFFYVFISPLLG